MKKMGALRLALPGVGMVFLVMCGCSLAGPSGRTAAVKSPDLIIVTIQLPPSQRESTFWTLGATVKNIGGADAGASTIQYQISTKSVLDSSATLIGTKSVPLLAPGATFIDTWSTSFSVVPHGTYWVFVTADSSGQLSESDATNNTASAAVIITPLMYSRIVIDTYLPRFGAPSSVDTFVSLFGPAGDTTIDVPNLWSNDNWPYTTETSAIAENGSTGNYGRVDYTGGLAPGTYYIRVRGVQSQQPGPYAIRVLDTAADSPTGPGWPWYFTALNQPETNPLGGSYEPDDNPLQGGIPTNPVHIALGQKLNRYLTAGNITVGIPGDVDWFVLTLP
jgi:hypothetical protein